MFYCSLEMDRQSWIEVLIGGFSDLQTIVGMSAYTMHSSVEAWGPDAPEFNPYRWTGPASKDLDKWLCTFSKGARMCLGQKWVFIQKLTFWSVLHMPWPIFLLIYILFQCCTSWDNAHISVLVSQLRHKSSRETRGAERDRSLYIAVWKARLAGDVQTSPMR